MADHCGQCGYEVRLFGTAGWRHIAVPAELSPHRAVLGTPAHKVEYRRENEAAPPSGESDAAPVIVTPAMIMDLDSLTGAPALMASIAVANAWGVTARGNQHGVSVVCSRSKERITGLWRTGDDGKLAFDYAATLNPTPRSLLASEMKGLLGHSATCSACDQELALHQELCLEP